LACFLRVIYNDPRDRRSFDRRVEAQEGAPAAESKLRRAPLDGAGAKRGNAPMTAQNRASLWRLLARGMWSSRLGVFGVVTTTLSAGLILAAFATELIGVDAGPYQGLVTYLLLPALFVFGLVLIPIGSYLVRAESLRRGESADAIKPIIVDLSQPSHRRFWGVVMLLSVINIAILFAVSYKGYHYTESTAFCGTLCHSVMEPEYTAYQRSPHARVACVECHIGPGAPWFVKSKLSGLRQVWAVTTGDFSRPIPTPVADLRPARDTCEQCHWPEAFHGNRPKVFREVAAEGDPKDALVTAVMLHVGGREAATGRYSGIHWHVSQQNLVEYRASDDKRLQIREVRVTDAAGKSTLFVKADMPPVPADAPWRTMDCVDCHNRPSHVYESPEAAVDRRILDGRIDAALPGVRDVVLQATTAVYASRDEAKQGIREAILGHYRRVHPELFAEKRLSLIAAADVAYQDIYAPNVYPALGIGWNTYPSHLGHANDKGCFRCHDDEHAAPSGEKIRQDCDLCHNILTEDERESALGDDLKNVLF